MAKRSKNLTKEPEQPAAPTPIYETDFGKMYWGDTFALLDGSEASSLRGRTLAATLYEIAP